MCSNKMKKTLDKVFIYKYYIFVTSVKIMIKCLAINIKCFFYKRYTITLSLFHLFTSNTILYYITTDIIINFKI